MTATTLPMSMTVPGVGDAVPLARHWVRLVLGTAGCVMLDDALLTVSELVGNAVKHSQSGSTGGLVTVVIGYQGPEMTRITVIDDGGATVPMPREPNHDLLDVSGRGLWLVNSVCRAWGVTDTDGGRRAVWALIPVADKVCDT
ncbi:hypothetical protein Misp01_46740 [Microtetraspora sp. NBRC 13810]|uniref:ATP-binding protein n=1 Tax=Microtetraspora sp. NBRC 13810 TaxID=3030990 RepID=UPI0024A41D6C|nr:ATP-binding protein [Microtetraspora sp. NBRC 13810]GLW09545.1 hypothetical protein Misp01_46740 [Microtetraspora sp. NBRC 13810]